MTRLKLLSLFTGAAIALGLASPAGADVVDPQIFVCTGCTSPPGGEPNILNPASINVGFAGNHTAVSPLLIIVGVPNGGIAPTLSLTDSLTVAPAGNYYGATTNGTLTGALDGVLTASSPAPPNNNAYAAVGLNTGAGGGSSENFANWSGFDASLGITATTFNLYAYGINVALDSGPGGNSPINIDFTNVTAGSLVIAYNCATSGPSCSGGDIGETPFTNAGGITTGVFPPPPPTIPEPGTLGLLGSALAGLSWFVRRRHRG
jgi:hypothetical protein